MAKIVPREKIGEVCEEHRSAGRTVVFTNGCFDVVHPGHVYSLYKARQEGDLLVVGLNSDESVRELKGPGRPVFPEAERAEVLASFFFVDHVVIFGELTPLELVIQVRPQVLVKGGDYRPDTIVGREEVERSGGRLVIIEPIPGLSSSNIIKKISGDGAKGS